MGLFDPRLIALGVFLGVLVVIALERMDRAVAAMLGAAILWGVGIIDADDIFHFIDLNVLALLFGMMVILACLREAGFFRWLGIKLANMCGCDPARLFILLSLTSALLSAFLTNVVAILFLVHITVELADVLEVSPVPFVMGEIFASNLGGTATMVGDPMNMMIASAFGLKFVDFIVNLAPIVTVCVLLVVLIWYEAVKPTRKREFLVMPVKAREVVKDRYLFVVSTGMFVTTIVLFALQDVLNLTPSTIALISSVILMGAVGRKVPNVFRNVDWETLIFLAAIFVVVGGLEKTGLIEEIAKTITYYGRNELLVSSMILWISALGSTVIDNIPLTATFIPMIKDVSMMTGMDVSGMIWALALGTGFGGNGTPIASSVNIVALGAMREYGHPITFKEFTKKGMAILALTTAIANLFIYLTIIL